MPAELKQLVYIICGPTASGKSSLAVEIANKSNGVIINADSLQLISALPILTAQPNLTETIPHFLYSIYPPGTHVSAGMWLGEALKIIEETLKAGKLPIVVGGTGLYLKALLEGLSPIPSVSLETRKKVNEIFENEGIDGLKSRLDEGTLQKYIDPQRLKRSLEVLLETGQSLLTFQQIKPTPPPFQFHTIGIELDRDTLKHRINLRLQQMLELGVLDEVRAYMETCDLPTKAIGYTEFKSYLLGEISLNDALQWTSIRTAQYAKRQSTWFRNQMR